MHPVDEIRGVAWTEAQAAAREALRLAAHAAIDGLRVPTTGDERRLYAVIGVLMKLALDEPLTEPYRVLRGCTDTYGIAALLHLLGTETPEPDNRG